MLEDGQEGANTEHSEMREWELRNLPRGMTDYILGIYIGKYYYYVGLNENPCWV